MKLEGKGLGKRIPGGRERAFSLWSSIPLVLFGFAFLVASFMLGVFVGHYEVFPYSVLRGAKRTSEVLRVEFLGPPTTGFSVTLNASNSEKISISQIPNRRIHIVKKVEGGGAFLYSGGAYRFLEYCPKFGCLAVIFSRDGTMQRSYPFLPEEFRKPNLVSSKYEELFFDSARDTDFSAVGLLPNGDLVISMNNETTFPSGGGVARVSPDGKVKWWRRDYSHHWASVLLNGEILTPTNHLVRKSARVRLRPGFEAALECRSEWIQDGIQILDSNGRLKDLINVYDAIADSPFRGNLLTSYVPCDPTHLNFVREVGSALAANLQDVFPDDLLVTLRNLNAVGVIGRKDHRLKRFFRGTFAGPHSAQPTPDGKILILDNLGGGKDGGPSRVLLYDPENGEEKTVIPNARMSKDQMVFTTHAGDVDVSPDGTRALVSLYTSGVAYEVSLPDGDIFTTFDNVHDVSGVAGFEGQPHDKAARFIMGLIRYVQ